MLSPAWKKMWQKPDSRLDEIMLSRARAGFGMNALLKLALSRIA
jgi:hypothetical protein